MWANPRITRSGTTSPTFSKIKQVPGKKKHWWDSDTCYWGVLWEHCQTNPLPFKHKQGWLMPTTVPQLLKSVYFKYPKRKFLCYPPILCIAFCYHCPFLQFFLLRHFWNEFRIALKQEFPEAEVHPCQLTRHSVLPASGSVRWSGGGWDVQTPLKCWWLFHSHLTVKELLIFICLKRKFCSKPSADPSRLCIGPIPCSRGIFFPRKYGLCSTEQLHYVILSISCQSHRYGNWVPNTILR